mmetsp:Transcript_61783/g.199199  ORF Transcript_61783/g.199199 Transcript_61783/m.199199 type:complete len:488 (-) Transcript_61783:61-1524(-)
MQHSRRQLAKLCSRRRLVARTPWARRHSGGLAEAAFTPLQVDHATPGAGQPLHIWAAGRGAPSALLVPPLQPGPRGDWRQWLAVARGLLRSLEDGGGDPEGAAVWIAEWPGLDPARGPSGPVGSHAAELAEAARRASAGGKLRLLAGAGSAGLVAVQALRLLHLGGGAGDMAAVRLAAVAPVPWAAPLPQLIGEDYPVRLARRQSLCYRLHKRLAAAGLGGFVARHLVPEAGLGADGTLLVAWWLGLLDPALSARDAAREILLSTRAVDPASGVQQYQAARAVATAQEVDEDDADDDDFAVGPLSPRSKQPRSAAEVPWPSHGACGAAHAAEALGSQVGRPFVGSAVPLLLLLPEVLPQVHQEAVTKLCLALEAVEQRLLQAATRLLESGSAANVEAAMEVVLFRALLELDGDCGLSRSMAAAGSAGDAVLAPSPEVASLTAAVLPISLRAVPGSLACLTEHPEAIARRLYDFAIASTPSTPSRPCS